MKQRATLERFGVTGRGLVIVLPYLWLMLFFVVPFVIVHAYVAPVWAVTEATRPVAPAVAAVGAVIAALGPAATTT